MMAVAGKGGHQPARPISVGWPAERLGATTREGPGGVARGSWPQSTRTRRAYGLSSVSHPELPIKEQVSLG